MQRRKLMQFMGAAGASSLALPMLASCSSSGKGSSDGNLDLWTHAAGNPEEIAIIESIIADFNKGQDKYTVAQEAFPQAAYNDSVTAGALSGELPDILDVDGPNVPNWAWAGHLQPLTLPAESINQLASSCVSSYQDEVYSVGLYDAAVSMFARESILEKHKIRIPTMDDPWLTDEFDEVLEKLGGDKDYKFAIDLGFGDAGEWFPYAFSPFLQSFGGDLLDRSTYLSAEGVLNSEAGVAFGTWFHSLFERGLTNIESTGEREEFVQGTAALAWNGNWAAVEAMETYDDVLFLPPPDFGNGPIIGGGSWQWSVSSTAADPEGANAYLEASLDPEYLAAFSNLTGLMPATEEAADLTDNYGPDGALRPIMEYSRALAKMRPETPAYPVISSEFLTCMNDIAHGGDVAESLDRAVSEIDGDIDSNGGYGF